MYMKSKNDRKMKIIKYIPLVLTALLSVSCMKDGEMLIASLGQESGTGIMTPDGDIVLSIDYADALALTLYWDEAGTIVLNNPDAQVSSDAVINAVQFSADADFSTSIETAISAGQYSLQLTGSQLNSILSRLGYEPGVLSPLYIRIRTALGDNTESVYGEALTVNVSSYYIDWSFVKIVPRYDAGTTTATLPAVSDGEYAGFINVPNSWYNFYFMENDNTIYGSGYNGETAILYTLQTTSDVNEQNCWLPEGSSDSDPAAYACWYLTMSRENLEWSAMRIRDLWLSYGEDESVEFEYNSGRTAWRAVFTTTADNTSVQLDEWGTLYNRKTTNDNPVSDEFILVASADNTLAMGEAGAATGITVPEAGTYTLILYLADMRWELLEGDQEITMDWPADEGWTAPSGENVHIYSLDDDETPSASAGILRNSDENVYSGFFNFTSGYTFKLGDNENPSSAAHVYGSAPVANSEEANYRLYSGEDMYPISYLGSAGLMYVTADFGQRSWSCESVSSVTVDFSDGDDLQMSVSAGVCTAEAEIASWGSGIRFTVNGGELSYTDTEADGTLSAGEAYFTPSVPAESGHRYRITLNLPDMTCLVEDITDEEEPEYPEHIYVFYTWNSGWPLDNVTEDAAILAPAGTDGTYTGYFSTGETWNFIFCDRSLSGITIGEIGQESRYGTSDNTNLLVKTTANSDDGTGAFWINGDPGLGLYMFDVDLTENILERTYLGSNIHVSVSGTETVMAFNTSTLNWEATVDIAAGSSLTFRLDERGSLVYGGADGTLAPSTGSNAVTVAEAGQYVVTVDLRDFSSLKYNLTKQN